MSSSSCCKEFNNINVISQGIVSIANIIIGNNTIEPESNQFQPFVYQPPSNQCYYNHCIPNHCCGFNWNNYKVTCGSVNAVPNEGDTDIENNIANNIVNLYINISLVKVSQSYSSKYSSKYSCQSSCSQVAHNCCYPNAFQSLVPVANVQAPGTLVFTNTFYGKITINLINSTITYVSINNVHVTAQVRLVPQQTASDFVTFWVQEIDRVLPTTGGEVGTPVGPFL